MDPSANPIEIVGCHAEGEVGDVIISGVEPPPGETLWDKARWIHQDGRLRSLVLNEPRGGVFRHVNLLVPPVSPEADAGFIIMEPEHTPPMSGSNTICVATVVLETGLVKMMEPVTELVLEAPGGLIRATVECRDGKAERVTVTNVPSFATQLGQLLHVEGIGTLEVDIAYGGDSFVMVKAADIGVELVSTQARVLVDLGTRIKRAANQQSGFSHPENPDWTHISFCQIADDLLWDGDRNSFTMKNAVVIDPGKLDRSPTGTGLSARLAAERAKGTMKVGDRLIMRSIIDSEFVGEILADALVGEFAAVVPSISGRAWITGRTLLTVDPTDPWPLGYRVADTWPEGPGADPVAGSG